MGDGWVVVMITCPGWLNAYCGRSWDNIGWLSVLLGKRWRCMCERCRKLKRLFDAWLAAPHTVAAGGLVDVDTVAMNGSMFRCLTPAAQSAQTNRIDGCGLLPMACFLFYRGARLVATLVVVRVLMFISVASGPIQSTSKHQSCGRCRWPLGMASS